MHLLKKLLSFFRSIWQKTDIRKPDSWLGTLVSLIFRLGTLFLMITMILLLVRIFKEEGYSIEAFLVPEQLSKNGFDGNVVARLLQDEYSIVKKEAVSIKLENFQTINGSEQPELNIAVMGFGISLRNIAFQLRELMGSKNHVIRCELTKADSVLGVTLRMTDFEAVTFLSPKNIGDRAAIQYLNRKICEQILKYTDPYRLSLYYQRKGKFNEALEVARNMLVENPTERHWAMMAMGIVHEEMNQFELALKEFDEAIKFEPNFALSYMRHAWLNQRISMDSLAMPYLEKALKFAPNDPSYWTSYGFVLNNLKRYDESDRAFEKVIKLAPNETAWYGNWGGCKERRGDKKGAKELYLTAIKKSQKINERLQNELNIAQLEQDTALALQKAMQLLDYEPNNIGIVQSLAQYHWNQRQYRELTQLNVKLRYNPDDYSNLLNYYNYRAMAFNMLGERDSALTNVNIAIEMNPTNPFPFTTLAEISAMNGDKNGFYTVLEKAFKMGFPPEQIVESDLPYKLFLKDARYLALVKKYRKEK
jgi:Flp pilus assembly protein TadD